MTKLQKLLPSYILYGGKMLYYLQSEASHSCVQSVAGLAAD